MTARLLGLFLVALAAAPGAEPEPLVVLISIDGLKPDYILQADRHGLRIPNLRRLATKGTYSSGVLGVIPTVTYPSHATIVTGVSPAKHGIVANEPFDPFGHNHGGWFWYAEDLCVPALWDAAAQAGLKTAAVHWPVSVGAGITWNLVQYWRAGTPDDHKLLRALSTPGLLAEAEDALGAYPDGIAEDLESDRRRAAFNSYLIEKKAPHLHLAYFTALDHEQHERGPYTPEAFAVLEQIDSLVGQLRAAAERVRGRRLYLCVVSDHGFYRVEKALHLNAALRKAGLIQVNGEGKVTGWRAFAWNNGGSAAVMLPERAGEVRSETRNVLDRLVADPANGILDVLDHERLMERGAFPTAAFLIALRPGYQMGDKLDGPVVERVGPRGTHGFHPDLPDMDAAFFLCGPGVARGKNLGHLDMRDIAPTLAALLGVSLPDAEGRNVIP